MQSKGKLYYTLHKKKKLTAFHFRRTCRAVIGLIFSSIPCAIFSFFSSSAGVASKATTPLTTRCASGSRVLKLWLRVATYRGKRGGGYQQSSYNTLESTSHCYQSPFGVIDVVECSHVRVTMSSFLNK